MTPNNSEVISQPDTAHVFEGGMGARARARLMCRRCGNVGEGKFYADGVVHKYTGVNGDYISVKEYRTLTCGACGAFTKDIDGAERWLKKHNRLYNSSWAS